MIIGAGAGAAFYRSAPLSSSSPVQFEPQVWTRSDLDVVTTGSLVDRWTDQIDGEDFVKTLNERRPTYITDGIPFLRFTAASSTELAGPQSGTLLGNKPFHYLMVSTAGAAGSIGGIAGGAPRLGFSQAQASYVNTASLSYPANSGLAVRHWYHDGVNVFGYREDGAPVTSAAEPVSAFDARPIYVGRGYLGVADCDVYEILVFTRILSAAEIAQIESYLLRRYGI